MSFQQLRNFVGPACLAANCTSEEGRQQCDSKSHAMSKPLCMSGCKLHRGEGSVRNLAEIISELAVRCVLLGCCVASNVCVDLSIPRDEMMFLRSRIWLDA